MEHPGRNANKTEKARYIRCILSNARMATQLRGQNLRQFKQHTNSLAQLYSKLNSEESVDMTEIDALLTVMNDILDDKLKIDKDADDVTMRLIPDYEGRYTPHKG